MRVNVTKSGEGKIKNTSDMLKSGEFKKKNPDVEAIRQAFITNDSTILFIAVIRNGSSKNKIYYFTKKDPTQPIIKEIQTRTTLSAIKDLWENVLEQLNEPSHKESDIETLGTKFSQHLLNNKDVLSAACEEMREVWIYSQDEILEPVWDWVFCEKKKAFWGDVFHIIRIPKKCEIKKVDFQINAFTFLLDKPCLPARRSDLREILKNLIICDEEVISSPTELKAIEAFDFVHVGAYRETFEKRDYLIELEDKLSQNKPKFLFLNMFNEEIVPLFNEEIVPLFNEKTVPGMLLQRKLLELINSFPPTIWIDSSLIIPDNFASVFVDCFYGVFKNCLEKNKEANIVEILAKTREIIKDQEKLGGNTVWRLAYVVNGNPYTKLTHS